MRRIITTAIIMLPLIGCADADSGSPAMDLVVTEDTEAVNHWMAPAGRMEITMRHGAGTIVRGQTSDIGKSGNCTVRWTDGEKMDALSGNEERKQFLDLPCANLSEATDADRLKRVPYGRMVPGASGPGKDYRGENQYLEAVSTAEGMPGSDGKVSLSMPVWACKSEKDYQERLGNVDAPCAVIL